MVERLAVIIGGLSAIRLAAVAVVTLQHGWTIGLERQRVAEVCAGCFQRERREGAIVGVVCSLSFPESSIQAANGFAVTPACPTPPRENRLAEAVGVGARHRGVRHPDLLIGPAFAFRPWLCCLTKQSPLQPAGRLAAVDKVRGEIPPFNPKIRMWSVISGEGEHFSRRDLRKAIGRLAEPGIALRARTACKGERSDAAGMRAENPITAHWQTP